MIQSDLLGLILVYGYVAVLLLFTEKIVAKKYPLASRKILHILVGNIAFFLPVFQTREIMVFVAAGPFILFTFLMSPYSPLKSFHGKTSEAGHGFGLVYYAIAWAVLAYFFFDHMEVIAIGILAMSYGDGFASLIGIRYGKRKYKVFGDQKSYVGSVAMVVLTFGTTIVALLFYGISLSQTLLFFIIGIAIVSAIIEGVTPKGLDNLSVPFCTALLYWIVNGAVI